MVFADSDVPVAYGVAGFDQFWGPCGAWECFSGFLFCCNHAPGKVVVDGIVCAFVVMTEHASCLGVGNSLLEGTSAVV